MLGNHEGDTSIVENAGTFLRSFDNLFKFSLTTELNWDYEVLSFFAE
jgi:hypothetical protein